MTDKAPSPGNPSGQPPRTPARKPLGTAALTAHILDAVTAREPVDPALGKPVGWVRAVREVARERPEAALKALEVLRRHFPDPVFAAAAERLKAGTSPRQPQLDARGAAEYLIATHAQGAAVEPDKARPAIWAEAIRGLIHAGQHEVVGHAIGPLSRQFPTPFFARTRHLMQVRQREENAPIQSAKRLRRYLEEAHARGRPVRAGRSSQTHWMTAMRALVKAGRLDVVTHALDPLASAYPGNPYLRNLQDMLSHLPDDSEHPTRFGEDGSLMQVVPFEGATILVVIFADTYASSLVHRWLHAAGVHAVYLRDTLPRLFTSGAPGLADGFDETIVALRALATSLGAKRIVFFGGSMWGYPAIRYALEMEGARALAYSPLTYIEEERIDFVIERARERGMTRVTAQDVRAIDLAPHVQGGGGRAAIRILYGADNPHDRDQAERLKDCPAVTLEPLEGAKAHNMLNACLQDGSIRGHVAWLLDGD